MSGTMKGPVRRPLLVAVAALAVAGCGRVAPEADPPATEAVRVAEGPGARAATAVADTTAHGAHDHGAPPAAARSTTPSDRSLYHSTTAWTDHGGTTLTLAELPGRARVVAMVYTHCSFACPRIMADMKRIEGRLLEEGVRDVGFVLVSIDPERDTPERLASFAAGARLDPQRWTLLTGDPEAVLELAVLLGVKYRATGQGDFAHSNLITVLSASGEIVDRVEGLGADVEPAVRTLVALAE